jgi:hypothetical protein
MLAMRLAVRSFLSSVRLAVLRTRQLLFTHARHWLPPPSLTAAPWATRCGPFKKRWPGRSLTGCSDDDDDDDNDDDDDEDEEDEELNAQ